MDNPGSHLTNVHKVEGVLFVQWAVYTVKTYVPDHLNSEDREDRNFESLQAAEVELRQDGHHVYHESAQDQLWVFVLSGPNAAKDPKFNEKTDHISAITSRNRLKRGPSGALRAADLAEHQTNVTLEPGLGKRKRTYSVLASPHEDGSLRAFQYNMSLDFALKDSQKAARTTQTSKTAPDNDSLYIRIITAISLSISYLLTESNKCLALSPGILIMRNSVLGFDDTISIDKAEGLIHNQALTPFFLEVIWQPNGTLIIICYPFLKSSWSQVSTASLHAVESVILSPFGWSATIAQAHGSPESHEPHPKYDLQPEPEVSTWRRACTTLLTRQGIHLTRHTRWISVTPADTSGSFYSTFEWPMHLCFQTNLLESFREIADNSLSDLENNVDPLSDAENWFLELDERIAKNKQSHKEKMEKESNAESSDDEDLLANLRPRNEEVANLQTPSGIYPTPPDGLISVTPAGDYAKLGTENDQSISKQDNTDHSTNATKLEVDLGTYNHLENDDLFGEIEADMFADNGITEDDFSFFDNPGNLRHPEHPIKGLEQVQDTPSEAQETLPQARGRVEGRAMERDSSDVDKARSTEERRNNPVSVGIEPKMGLENIQSSKVKGPNTVSQHSTTLNTWPNLQPKLSGQNETDLDHKYVELGKYAPSKYRHPSTTGPRTLPSVQNTIPELKRPIPSKDKDLFEDSDISPDEDNSPGPESEYSEHSDSDKDFVPSNLQNKTKKALESPSNDNGIPHAFMNQSPPDSESFYSSKPPTVKSILQSLHSVPIRRDGQRSELMDAEASEKVSPKEYIMVAQIFADQFVQYDSLSNEPTPSRTDQHSSATTPKDPICDFMPFIFPQSIRCTLELCASLGEEQRGTVPISRATPRSMVKKQEHIKSSQDSEARATPSIFHIPTPTVRVKRGDVAMDISSTAIRFWMELGLSSFLGPKDVIAFCIYPNKPMLRRGASLFLNDTSQTYLSFRLGSHLMGHSTLKDYPSGLVPTPPAVDTYIPHLKNTCEKLGRAIAPLAALGKTITVYIVNPFSGHTALYSLCASFYKLYDTYASCVRHTRAPGDLVSDLVLQIIPFSWIGSSSTIAMQAPRTYIRLAKIIYDRFPVQGQDISPYASASLFRLAEGIPKSLDFKLSSDSPKSLFQHVSAAHIGYSWDVGCRWLCSAMTDSFGCHHWSASYFLGSGNDPWSNFRAAAKEIWETFLEAIDVSYGSHRLYISKISPMPPTEINAWTSLFANNSTIVPIFVVLDEEPPIYISDPNQLVEHIDLAQVTTPSPLTPEVPSPDVTGPKFAEESDPNARLLDKDEEAWGVISARSIIVRSHGLDICSDLANAYLVRGNRSLIGVRIVHAEKPCDLKELLSIYHGLSILTKARGISSALPWHLAFAQKAHQGLEGLK